MRASTNQSGEAWIGVVPERWSVEPLGRWFRERKATVSDADFAPLSVTMQGIVPQLENVAKTDNNANRKLVRKGDFAINSRSDRKGSAGVSGLDGSVSVITTVLQPRGLNPRFTHHLLRSRPFQEEFYRWGHGIVDDLWSTKWSDMKSIKIPVPPEPEQRAIADYLDRETAQIDAFIAKNEELIALLAERRASVIGGAVTRGTDEAAELSTEGPDWIGAVPAAWTVQPIKNAYSVVVGKMLNESKSEGEPVPYVRAANIQPEGLDLSDVKEMKATAADRRALALRSGDVVFVEGGGGYGRSDYLTRDLPGWVFQNHVIRLRSRPGHDGRFLNYWLQHVRQLGHYEALSAFATIPNVSGDKLGRIEMPVPSLSEQREIVEHIEEATSQIDAAVAVAQRSVDLARERRAALISAAVTGKIDVGVAV